jgi:SNF2 family DNA or RNA helicase
MAVLHGSWQTHDGILWVWGETWQPSSPQRPSAWEIAKHPSALSIARLKTWVSERQQAGILGAGASALIDAGQPLTRAIALPSSLDPSVPLHSAMPIAAEDAIALQPWWVEGLALPVAAAMDFLQALPLNLGGYESEIGSDLRFWSHVARWSLDLAARCKAIPGLMPQPDGTIAATWQPLLESSDDRTRLDRLSRHCPAVCRFYQSFEPPVQSTRRSTRQTQTTRQARSYQPPVIELPPHPQTLLLHFLGSAVDLHLRRAAGSLPLPGARRAGTSPRSAAVTTVLPMAPVVRDWLQKLGSPTGQCDSSLQEALPLATGLSTWAASLDCVVDWPSAPTLAPSQTLLPTTAIAAPFRTAFRLVPPAATGEPWQLVFGLQAAEQEERLRSDAAAETDPPDWIDAAMIWQFPAESLQVGDRRIPHPQETLLRGLGLAARLYPPLAASLEQRDPGVATLTPVQAYEFIRVMAWRFQDNGLGVVLPPSLAQREGWANRLGLKVAATVPAGGDRPTLGLRGLLNFRWELTIGGQTLSKAQFEELLRDRNLDELPLVEIKGEWVELRPADVRAAQDFFTKRQGDLSLSLEDALRIGTGETQTLEKLPVVSFEASGALEGLMATLSDNQAIAPVPTPADFCGQLRPYQERGVSWLTFLEQWGLGACLADDMGLGKTIQLIAFLLHLKERGDLNGPVLLVCPTSVLGNWQREIARFGPSLNTILHHGSQRLRGKALARAAADVDVTIVSYALVFRDEMTLQQVPWRGIVLDEAQNIKNSDAKQSQAVRRLVELPTESDPDTPAAPVPFRIALTGTPVENRLAELWSIIDFLNPGYLGPKNFFQRRFAVPIERYGDGASLQTLRSLVQPFILRRLKTDRDIAPDLPDKQEMTVFCPLSEQQADLYQQWVERSLAEIESSEGIQRRGQILVLLVKLKQLCNHPVLLDLPSEDESESVEPVAASDRPDTQPLSSTRTNITTIKSTGRKGSAGQIKAIQSSSGASRTPTPSPTPVRNTKTSKPRTLTLKNSASPKLQRLVEMLDEVLAEGDRALIFTQFARWGELLQAHLQRTFGQEVLFFHGGTPQAQRDAMVDRFQNDPQAPKLFILSLKAGGVGLNLTRANHVFHYDRWWNPAVENQATDRAFRIGQTRNVQVHKFVCTGTLEEKIHDLIESKKLLAEQVVGTGENWLSDLDSDRLRDLLILDRSAAISE